MTLATASAGMCAALAISLVAALLGVLAVASRADAQPVTAQPVTAQPTTCAESTGDPTPDQTSINTYQSSFNRDLIGNTALLGSYTNDGSDLDVYAPVWGRQQILGILGDRTPDASLHPEYDAVGPVSVRAFNDLAEVTGTVPIAEEGDHGNSVYQYAVRAVGARGITEVHRWRVSGFTELARTWLRSEIDGVDHPFLVDHELAGAYTLSIVSGSTPDAVERFIDDADVTVVAAAGNSGLDGAPVVPWAAFYNAIAIGTSPQTWNGAVHSSSGTSDGRQKPDLVVSNGNVFTSFSAPLAAAQVLRLREAATCYLTSSSDALRSETIKALLLAGANQTGAFEGTEYTWTRSDTAPLDPRFGAGTVDLYSSYLIMRADEQPARVLVGQRFEADPSEPQNAQLRGWDHIDVLPANSDAVMTFGGNVEDLTMAATWSYEVDDDLEGGSLANVDLALLAWNADCTTTEIQASRSPVDNTEYLRIDGALDADQYSIVISNTSDVPAEIGIAWDATATGARPAPYACDPSSVSGDVTCDGVVDAADAQALLDYLVGARTAAECPLTASNAQLSLANGDVDADGAIDVRDSLLISQCVDAAAIAPQGCPADQN